MDACTEQRMANRVESEGNAMKDMSRGLLLEHISNYVASLETELTEQTCLCEWHELETAFGLRKVKSHISLMCPNHTKEGLIFRFVTEVLCPEEFADVTQAPQV